MMQQCVLTVHIGNRNNNKFLGHYMAMITTDILFIFVRFDSICNILLTIVHIMNLYIAEYFTKWVLPNTAPFEAGWSDQIFNRLKNCL